MHSFREFNNIGLGKCLAHVSPEKIQDSLAMGIGDLGSDFLAFLVFLLLWP